MPDCAPLAVPYVPFQQTNASKYSSQEALSQGTLFPGLNLPFHLKTVGTAVPKTPLTELQALCFVVHELGLYLDTHQDDQEAFALAEVILRGVNAALAHYLKERPLLRDCSPDQELFVNPIFNLQRYAPGEGFKRWHCDWTLSDEATEPQARVLAWILYCNDLPDGGTEFHWQGHHEEAERGKLVIFPAGLSHIHRGRVSHSHTKTIATGWINAGHRDGYLRRLAAS